MLANEAHWISAYALLALVFLHISGVIKHRFFEPKEHDVLKRMI
jgi:cytochrome b561